MTETTIAGALVAFDAAIATTTEVEGVWAALQALADVVVGAKLFTVMKLDWANERSGRTYTSHPDAYPVSGTKPINRTHWFDKIYIERQPFVANTIKDIADVFPDHEVIWSLGCGSVLNWPVFVADKLVGTVNMLHEEHFYTPKRVAAANQLSLAAKLAFLAVEHIERR
ncbi:GAF domain-containing protein [Aminobacter sp. HY435]|uniref:GAF domain-containing protein n=1 Tax=Aminobacter sp. HY435 TaxID=2970917 RepID=UPI0022B9BD1B|nr:GAF domain-containing protein [Aminobacter sp. HY435]